MRTMTWWCCRTKATKAASSPARKRSSNTDSSISCPRTPAGPFPCTTVFVAESHHKLRIFLYRQCWTKEQGADAHQRQGWNLPGAGDAGRKLRSEGSDPLTADGTRDGH